MKIHRSMVAGFVVGIAALALSSCAYDPYYSGASYSSASGGYGSGYGYGGSNFTTSFFVSTGSPRWGYDPYAGAYYDYNRRCYYDPYLTGYYPIGYRPRYVYGAPHPHGWRSGRSYIAPPTVVRNYNITNYQNRTSRYQNLGRDWSRNVRSAPPGRDQRPSPTNYRDQRSSFDGRGSAPSGFSGGGRTRGEISQDQQRGNRSEPSRSRDGFRGSRGSVGAENTTIAAPQAPDFRERRRPDRGAFPQDSERQRGEGRGSRQAAPTQVEPQARPERPQRESQGDGGGGGRGRGEFRGGGGGETNPGAEGGGRGRGGVRGLGEG